jgi:signal transduction histidine kinase
MKSAWYTKRIVGFFVALTSLFAFTRARDLGITTLLYSIQVVGPLTGAYFLRKNRKLSQISSKSYWFFFTSLVLLSLSDLIFYLLIYLKLPGENPLIEGAVSVPYMLAYSFAIFGFIDSFERPILASFKRPIFWVLPMVLIAVSVPYLIVPLFSSGDGTLISIINKVATSVELTLAIAIVSVCFYVLLSTRNMTWSILALGFFSMGLTDWNASIETYNLKTTAVSFNAYTWTMSGLLIALAMCAPKASFDKINPFRSSSLIGRFRLYMYSASTIPLWLILIYAKSNLTSVVIVSVAFMWSALVIVLISQAFLEQIKEIGSQIRYLASESRDAIEKVPDEFKEEILTAIYRKEEQSRALAEARITASERVATVARQVAHDVRSPLAALIMVDHEMNSTLDEPLRIIFRKSIDRITEIANDLLAKNPQMEEIKSDQLSMDETQVSTLLSSLVSDVVNQKMFEYGQRPELEIKFSWPSCLSIFSKLDPSHLRRILSNLINNAAEAIGSRGNITVSLISGALGKENFAFIDVVDDGPGISESALKRIGQPGVSLGKEGGFGLGLSHAKNMVSEWGGSLEIETKEGAGTKIRVALPTCEPDKWLATELSISKKQRIVVADDDSNIHGVWNYVLGKCGRRDNCVHFSSPEKLLEMEAQQALHSDSIYLIDYEFIGSQINGLDLIEKLKAQKHSILVTSRFEDPEIRARAELLGVKILPKALASLIHIDLVG